MVHSSSVVSAGFALLMVLNAAGALAFRQSPTGPLAAIVVDGKNCTLRDAIRAANQGGQVGGCFGMAGFDTIILDADVVLTSADPLSSDLDGGLAGLPDVTTGMRIEARDGDRIERDADFDCGSGPDFRLLTVRAGGSLTLSGLTLSNGCLDTSGDVAGGAILVRDGNLSLLGVTLVGNTASSSTGTARGGAVAVFSSNGTHAFDASVTGLVENRAEAVAGDAHGGAVMVQGAIVELEEVVLAENQALAGAGRLATGGAIALSTTHAGTFSRVAIRDNRAEAADGASGSLVRGGGLSTQQPIARLEDCDFSGNIAQAGDASGLGGSAFGGGMDGLAAIVHRTSFVGNAARGGAGSPGGDGQGGGLAVILPSRSTTLFNATFANNTAVGGDGGGDGAGGGIATTGANWFDLRASTFAGNSAVAGTNGNAAGGWAITGSASFGARSSLFADNFVVKPSGTTAVDCDAAGPVDSLGYNLIDVNQGCQVTATDRSGVDPQLAPVADNGCTTPLLDGSCVPTVAIDESSLALERGHCIESGANVDARGFARPFDVPSVSGPGDECDAGAFEYRGEPRGLAP